METERAEKKLIQLKRQVEVLAQRIARLPEGIDERIFIEQMRKLQDERDQTEKWLTQKKDEAFGDEVVKFDDFMSFTAILRKKIEAAENKPEIQTEIIRKLVHRIEIKKDGFEIEFYVGKNKLQRELGDFPRSRGLRPSTLPLPKFLKDSGSKRLTNGGLRRN